MDRFIDVLKLIHQFLVDLQTAGGIKDQKIILAFNRFLFGLFRHFDGVDLGSKGKEIDLDLFGELFELIDSGWPVDVKARQKDFLIQFVLMKISEFARARGFA